MDNIPREYCSDTIIEEPFYYNERVDVIKPKIGKVMDAQIISIRGPIFVVKYTDTKEEENIYKADNLILKQWRPGRPFHRLNRVDIKDKDTKRWYEGLITNLNDEHKKVLIRYMRVDDGKLIEIWEAFESKNIAPIGIYSGRFNPALHSTEEINRLLTKKKRFYNTTDVQERKFRDDLNSSCLKIREIHGDGNCLYRAISDQVYGTENYYRIVKSKCLNYLDLEKEFFSQFVEGGQEKFEEYLAMKEIDGVWGDDVEIQAMSEIYNRPIEIYSHSKEPLKTFHEIQNSFTRGLDRENKINNIPIRISYHGRAHYNSLTPTENYHVFKNHIINTPPGEYENIILEKVKLKNIQRSELENNNTNIVPGIGSVISERNLSLQSDETIEIKNKKNINTIPAEEKYKLEISRENFLEKRLKDLDKILEEQLSTNIVAKQNLYEKNINIDEILIQSEANAVDDEILKSVLELSIKDKNNPEPNQSSNYSNITDIPSVKFIIEMGFTLEEAIIAYSAVGEDLDLMLQYLYSLNLN